MSLSRSTVLLLVAAAALLASFAIDLHLTRHYAGVDLRDKVVGSRSLLEGRSLYFDPWRPGEAEELADPMLPLGTTLTRYTGTPFQALLMAPLAKMPFGTARLAWLLAQYALLLLALWTTARAYGPRGPQQVAVLAGVLMLFLAARSWHLHVERGQVYVIAAAMIAGLFAAVAARRELAMGVLVAALVLLKPTYAVIAAPLLLVATPRVWLGGGGFLLGTAGVFALLPGGLRAWAEYRTAMQAWSGFIGRGEPPVTEAVQGAYPATIEGIAGLDGHHPMEFEDGSVTSILYAFGVELPGWAPWALFIAMALAVVLVAGRRLRRLPATDLLLLGFCGWTVLMWLLPVPRFDYQVVHWAAPLAVLLLTHRRRPFAWDLLATIAAALLLGAWPMLPVNVLLAEAIMVALVAVALWRRMAQDPVAPDGVRAPAR